jgi:hypothetical protein
MPHGDVLNVKDYKRFGHSLDSLAGQITIVDLHHQTYHIFLLSTA